MAPVSGKPSLVYKSALRVPKGEPDERWSSRQLLAYIERRRIETPSEEAERLRARVEAQSTELTALRTAAASGVAGKRVAGKAALADFRRETWRKFSDAVLRLPETRRTLGMAGVRLAIASELDADLYLLGVTAPRGNVEARERDRLRRILDSPPFAALLSRADGWADRLRVLYLSQTARAFYRPSVWAVYERASEDHADRWGNVDK